MMNFIRDGHIFDKRVYCCINDASAGCRLAHQQHYDVFQCTKTFYEASSPDCHSKSIAFKTKMYYRLSAIERYVVFLTFFPLLSAPQKLFVQLNCVLQTIILLKTHLRHNHKL